MSVEDSLASNAPFVLIEAPAGCGKTHTACDYARAVAGELSEGQRVLVLAHSNAAVGEFRSRTEDIRLLVKVATFDSLSLSIIAPYAQALGLPYPLRVGTRADQILAETLAPRAADLLARCPAVAQMLARLHPAAILDEHQDANRSQHAIAMALRDAGSIVRAFADPMQRIFVSEAEFPWVELVVDADLTDELTQPHRWAHDLELGQWILDARARLAAGGRIDLRTAPPSVRMSIVPGPDIGNYGFGAPNGYFGPIRAMPAGGTGALLTARVRHMRTLRTASMGRAEYYEGSDLDHMYQTFDLCEQNKGNPEAIATALLSLLGDISTGLTAEYRRRIDASLRNDRIDYGRPHTVKPILDALSVLYESPDIFGAARVCRVLLARMPPFLHVLRPAALRNFSALLPGPDEPYDQLQAAVTGYKLTIQMADTVVATVHRSKGHQFEHVLISNVSVTHFPDDDEGRRLLYVAVSRCRRSLVILVPSDGRSPLIG